MHRLFLLYLLLPLQAIAADDVDKEGHWFGVAMVAGLMLYWFIKQPESYRKSISRSKERHEKYVSWIREQSEHCRSISDDNVWRIIEEAVTMRLRVMAALFFLLIVFIYELYPLYAEPILGPNPPYWQEMLLGVTGGGVFAALAGFAGHISLRMRIKKLIGDSENRAM